MSDISQDIVSEKEADNNIKLLGKYENGNYTVMMYDDGTKIRTGDCDKFIPSFAENCDVKITDKCDGGCPMCYEGCTIGGRHANLLDAQFIDTLHPYTELAINGNDLSHPELIPFLAKLKNKKIITNMTVNQIHFERNLALLKHLVDNQLIWGLGVSLHDPTPEFVLSIKSFPNIVVHTINGLLTKQDLSILADNDLKLLILGYKPVNRGADYYVDHTNTILENTLWLRQNIDKYFSRFSCVSFDNLALNQLNIRRFLSDEEWEIFYMGDDGTFTFYIDMVEGTFAKNSVAPKEERFSIGDKSIDDMFQIIRQKYS